MTIRILLTKIARQMLPCQRTKASASKYVYNNYNNKIQKNYEKSKKSHNENSDCTIEIITNSNSDKGNKSQTNLARSMFLIELQLFFNKSTATQGGHSWSCFRRLLPPPALQQEQHYQRALPVPEKQSSATAARPSLSGELNDTIMR